MKFYLNITFILLFSLLVSCGSKNETGVVGEAITLNAETMESGDDLDITWEIIEQPDASWLNVDDAEYSDDMATAIFIPDEPGIYTFKVTISQYGDEVSSQTFSYDIEDDGDNYDDEDRPEVTEEEWLTTTDSVDTEETVADTEIVAEEPAVPEPVASMEKITASPPPRPKKQVVPGSKIPFDKERFTIQVASRRNLRDAEKVAADLIDAGFDAYIQKAYFVETDQTWYRVRVGSYNDIAVAKSVASAIAETYSLSTWIDHVRIEQ